MNSLWQAPVVVVALMAWLNTPPTSFADAAQREALRRQLMPKPTRQLTNLNLPDSAIITEATLAAAAASTGSTDDSQASAATASSSAAPAKPAAQADSHDQKWWQDRVSAARQLLSDHQSLAAALQSQINGLTADFTSRDDPAQRAKIANDRQAALDQLNKMNKQIEQDQKAIAAVQDDGRKQGVPPSWIR